MIVEMKRDRQAIETRVSTDAKAEKADAMIKASQIKALGYESIFLSIFLTRH